MYADPDEMRESQREFVALDELSRIPKLTLFLSRYCVIAALKPEFAKIHKAWIPMDYNTGGCDGDLGDGNIYLWQNLQDYNEKVQLIDGYFMSLGLDWNARRTLMVSEYSGDTGAVQLCLPEAQLNGKGGHLDLKVWCSKNRDDVNFGKVEIMDWENFEKSGQMPDMSDLGF